MGVTPLQLALGENPNLAGAFFDSSGIGNTSANNSVAKFMSGLKDTPYNKPRHHGAENIKEH